jgi:hypothetical protein
MSILGRLMGTAETAARSTARGGRTSARPGRASARPGRGVGRGVAQPTGRRGFGRSRAATPAPTSGGLGQLVGGLLRRR